MELGEPDASGRRRPVPVKGGEFIVPADAIIISIGNMPSPLVPQTFEDIEITRKGTIVADPETMATSKPGVYTAGEIVSGAATIIIATGTGQGKKASRSIHKYLIGQEPSVYQEPAGTTEDATETGGSTE